MGTPNGTGLVEINGTKVVERGFFCMQLVQYLDEEAEKGTEFYEREFGISRPIIHHWKNDTVSGGH